MKTRMLSWALIFSLLFTLLPVSAMAAEETLPEDGQLPAAAAQCTCGAQPDESGVIIHKDGCPLAVQAEPALETEEPTTGAEEPVTGTEEPVTGTEEPAAGMEEPAAGTEEPATGTEEPATGMEEPAAGTEEPVPEPEEPVPGTEKPVTGTEEPAAGTEEPVPETAEPVPEVLTPPTLTCEPLDEEESSDMVLTVEGDWDSYAWEACTYGFWSDWPGNSPSLILSKEEFTSYGFRCTVTLGEQSVTSEVFAYDSSVLERPMLMANGLADSTLADSSDYIKFGKRLPNSPYFNIKGLDDGYEIQTTYADAGYRTAISVNNGTKMTVFYRGEPISVGNSLTAETHLEIVYGGRYVKVTYEVTNTGSTTQNFRIGSSADVMIDNNDHAQVVGVKSSTGEYTGLSMSGSPKNSYQFNLVAPDCDALWYGYYSKAYINIFNNRSDKDTPYSKDSGMAWSWNSSVAPGQTWSRYVLIGAGELPPAPNAPTLSVDSPTSWTTGTTVNVTGTAAGSHTVYVNFNGTDYEGIVQNDGSFSIDIPVPEDSPVGPSSFTYWSTTNDGGISEIKTQPVNIIAGPSIHLTTGSVTVMEDETGLGEAWLRNFIKSSYGKVTIAPTNIDTSVSKTIPVTYTAQIDGFPDKTAALAVTVLPKPAELTQTTVSESAPFALTATMKYTGGLTYTETGFVYGALQNPTLTLSDGKVTTTPTVTTKDDILSAAISKDKLAYGVTYYARAYAKASDGTVLYGEQSEGFGVGTPHYGTFSVTNNGNSTFTITRTGGTDGEQTVYYRTVNGSAIGGTHFDHQADSVTFPEGETTATVPVTEYSVTNPYGSHAATAYSNADRTYSLEIYRVTGGATIDEKSDSATRTMTVSNDYHVSTDLFTGKSTIVKSGDTVRGDADKDNMGWTATSEGDTEHSKETVDITAVLPNRDYWTNLPGAKLWYRVSFEAWESEDGYQHIQVNPGESLDRSIVPNEGLYNTESPNTAVYAATFEHKSGGTDTNHRMYSFPITTDHPIPTGSSLKKEIFCNGSQDGKILLPITESHVSLGFNGSGEKSDKWNTKDVTHYLGVYDTREPQLLGVAPMAGGSYLPGDEVTVALVFDEIVDGANSPSISSVQVVTSWGTFRYAGGVNTNVLHFTGTVSGNANGRLVVQSITNASYIKDMADDTGTNTGGTVSGGDTGANLGTGANAPTVAVSDITNTNGTLTGTITASNAGKLEYAWSTEANEKNVVGWKLLADTGSDTVSTRQTSGTWHLHARATNGDGVTTYASSSYTFQDGTPVELPSLTAETDNTSWAKERVIMVTRSPADADVTVKTPDGSSQAVFSSIYTAIQNGTYTFTLESGNETITKMVTVSRLDRTAPTVEIVELTNLSHTEAVTLTVHASDGESQIKTVTGTWSNGTTTENAVISGTNGIYTTTSPDQSGEWTLTVTVTDQAGNTRTADSSAYTINADRPALEVTRTSSSVQGENYSYTVTANGNTGITVALPDGTITHELSGSFTITEPGDYIITVTDDEGHFVSKTITVTGPEGGTLDGVAPEVRLSIADENWTQGPVTVSVAVYDAGSVGNILIASQGGQTVNLTESADEPGSFTGSFTVSANGAYTVTCSDAVGNIGSGAIQIKNIDTTAPSIAVSGNPENWTADNVTITLIVEDTQSGVGGVEVRQGENTVSVSGSNGTYTFTVSENGVYTVTATDKIGNHASQIVTINKIDKEEPTLTVVGGTHSAASLTLAVTAVAGGSGCTVKVTKDGQNIGTVQNGSYTVTAAGTYTFTATTGTGKAAVQTVKVHSITIGGKKELVADEGKVTEPVAPTEDGYTFTGWYSGNTLWDFTNHKVTQNLTLTARWTLDAPEVTLRADPNDASGAYNGGNTVVTLAADAAHAAGQSIRYTYQWYKDGRKLDGKTDSTLELSAVADSGKYTVTVTAEDTEGLEASSQSSVVTVTIHGATPDYTVPAGLIAAYGDALSSVKLPEGWTWEDEDALVGSAGKQSHAAIFTPNDTENYETVKQNVTVTVNKAVLTPWVYSVEDKEYDGNADSKGTISLTGGVNGERPAASGVFTFANANVGADKTVKVTVTLDGSWGNNYELSTAELTATAAITPKTVGLTWHGYENLVYTGQPVSVTAEATGLVDGDECAVITAGGSEIGAGEYTATATGLDNSNYRLPADGTTRKYTIAQATGSACVTMAGWTYGETAATPVPVSDTNGTGHITYQYTGRDGTAYDSDAIPTGAGSYTVTAIFAAVDNYAEITAAADFTIAPKPIFATWSALTHVYDGTQKAAGVTSSGVLTTDDCTLSVSSYQLAGRPVSAPTGAGTYTAAAVLTGTDAHNYALKNSTAALTIQPKPVIFAVDNNAVQADGNGKYAAITADDAGCPYTVTYRQDGEAVPSPKQPGAYEVWVEITSPNYRHTDGSDKTQVGTLTITQAPPVVYTVSFEGGESVEGTAPTAQTAVADGQLTLPANPFAKENHLFTGWTADGDTKLYQPGDGFIMPARNVTFTAQWQEVFTVNGTVTEEGGGDQGVEKAVVSLWLGANKISETHTGTDGTYSFPNLIPGIYNLVVTKDVRTVTSKVELTENKTCDAVLPKGATNSVVEVIPGSPDIVVGKLDTVFDKTDEVVYTQDDQETVDAGGKVEITFIADEKQKGDQTIAGDMEKITATMDNSATVGLVMDYTLQKTVTDMEHPSGTITSIAQSSVLLEVLLPLPTQLQGKDSYSVFRVHDGHAQELKQDEINQNELGEYFTINGGKTQLTLFVKCFSTYAIGYTEAMGSGSSGGWSPSPVYPPSIEQTEHGSVTASPKTPQQGDKVTITPTPEDSFTVDEVIVTGPSGKPVAVTPNGDGTYTFTQPDGTVTIAVTFRPIDGTSECPRDESCPMADYSDTDLSAWYHDGVHYCVEHGLMTGTSKTAFAPNTAATRGMIATILWRLEGSPVVNHSMDYDDVKPEDWYGEAVAWADSAGVVTGYGNGTFGPNAPITREQMAAMLWRYAGSPTVEGSLSSFADGAQTSDWAQSAMIWAVEQGLFAGVGHNQLQPRGQATRAQVAAILMGLAENMAHSISY